LSNTYQTLPQYRSPARRRLPSGTTKYSRGYSECQRNRTGENLRGRYLAALSVTPFRKRTRCCRPLSQCLLPSRSCKSVATRFSSRRR